MKLERIHEYILPAVATLAGMILAMELGTLTGKGAIGTTSIILIAAASVALCVWMGSKTWILIPMTWEMTGFMPITNLPLGVRDIVVGFVVGSYTIFYALKLLRTKAAIDKIDFLIWAMVLYIVTVYIRNPVGLSALGSQKVGGRPYADAAVALLAFGVLARAPIDAHSLRRLPIFLLAGTSVQLFGSLITYIFPSSAAILGELYSGFATAVQNSLDPTERKMGLSLGSNTALRVLCSYFIPITLVNPLHFFRFSAATISLIGVLLSGFRSVLALVLLYGVVASFFRRRIHDIFVMAAIGLVAVGVLGLGNGRLFTLPLAVQRALTIFPGNWDYVAVADAEYSTQWRLNMWKIVLTEDRYIQNRLLGDGYGFTRAELAIMQSEVLGGTGFVGAASQEGFMISGMYHSGPLSAIRYVGYVGLSIFTALLFLVAAQAWRLIRKTEGTDLFAPALFIGMPAIIFPVIFCLFGGQFQYDLPATFFSAGLLKLLDRGIKSRESIPIEYSKAMPRFQPGSSTVRPARPSHVYR